MSFGFLKNDVLSWESVDEDVALESLCISEATCFGKVAGFISFVIEGLIEFVSCFTLDIGNEDRDDLNEVFSTD